MPDTQITMSHRDHRPPRSDRRGKFRNEGGDGGWKEGGGGKTWKKKGAVEPSVFAYYRRCATILQERAFESDDEKKEFLKSVFETLSQDGFKVLQNQTLSRIIESLVEAADAEMLNVVFTIFAKNWDSSSCDRFAHRILQKSLEVYQTLLHEAVQGKRFEEDEMLKRVAVKVADFCAHITEHYPQYIQSQQASFILRAFLKLACGLRTRVVEAVEEVDLLTPAYENYKPMLKDLVKTFLFSPHLSVSIEDPLTNLFIQLIITCLHYKMPKKMKKFVKYLLNESGIFEKIDEETESKFEVQIPAIFTSHQGSYFMERIIRLMPSAYFDAFVEAYFSDNVVILALHPASGFVLQRVIERVDEVQFSKLLAALAPQADAILAEGQFCVLKALVSRGAEWPAVQRRVVSALRRCLRCSGDDPAAQEAFLGCLLAMRPLGAASEEEEAEEVTLHGALVAQRLLRYEKTGILVGGFLAAPAELLSRVAQDVRGSHVVDALFASPAVPVGKKLEVVERMQPFLGAIACSKYGSRVLEGLWDVADEETRRKVAGMLAVFKEKLRSDRFGHFVCRKFSLLTLHRKRRSEAEPAAGRKGNSAPQGKKAKL